MTDDAVKEAARKVAWHNHAKTRSDVTDEYAGSYLLDGFTEGFHAAYESQTAELSTLRAEIERCLEIISSVAYDVDKFGSIDGPTWVKIRAALSLKEKI